MTDAEKLAQEFHDRYKRGEVSTTETALLVAMATVRSLRENRLHDPYYQSDIAARHCLALVRDHGEELLKLIREKP